MKQIFHRAGALIFAAAVVLAACLPLSARAEETAADTAEEEPVSAAEWMKEIPDYWRLSEISIPGTNNTLAKNIFPGLFLKSQGKTFAKQLEAGFRFFDIGLSVDTRKTEDTDDDRLIAFCRTGRCRKGSAPWSASITLSNVLSDAYSFLDEHPSETIILCVKNEDGKEKKTFSKLFFKAVAENASYWYLDNTIPALGEVRGKIVLASRFSNAADAAVDGQGLYFHWTDQDNREAVDLPYTQTVMNAGERLWVQDRYMYDVGQKWDAFTDTMDNCQADESTFSLNFLSTRGSSDMSRPKYYADCLNDRLYDSHLTEGVCYGIIVVDYGTEKLARHIFESNFMN